MNTGTERASFHVAVIGAGAVGAVSALELLRRGHRVTIVEPGEPGGEQASSFGNAGWLSPHAVVPPATPGVWKQVPGWLLDPKGPLHVRWRHLPRLLPWLLAYLRSGWTETRLLETARALRPLLRDAPLLHRKLAQEAGVAHLIERQGVLHLYADRAAFEADALGWRARRSVGVDWLELSAEELRQREPLIGEEYRFAVLVEEGGRCLDPAAYVAALLALARDRDAVFRRTGATGFRFDGDRLRAVITADGDVTCEAAVIAAGARSKPLAAAAGDSVPLETERGYHVTVEGLGATPRFAAMAMDRKMIVSPMEGGLRAAGLVELADLDAEPDWRRADVLLEHLRAIVPSVPADLPATRVRRWLGRRPSLPDGRPCIGYARRSTDVVHAFGHGHVGLAASARTGRVVAQLVSGEPVEIDVAPFDPRRWGH
ncbi:MAG: NAD(P)/FAD-dependent oxidoreductase [Pseudomonadota bacterium]